MPEQPAKETATLATMPAAVTSSMPPAVPAFAMMLVSMTPRGWLSITGGGHRALWRIAGSGLRRGCGGFVSGVALDDFVELAAVKPDPPALRAIVDLDPLPIGEHEVYPAHRAEQALGSLG